MPLEATCPACSRKMRIPEHLLGRRVKCPSCQHAFQTVAEEKLPARLPPIPAKLPGYHVQAPPERRNYEDELAAAKRGRTPYDDNRDSERRRSRYDDEDDDDFREDDRRRKRRGKRRAREMCLLPGILMIVIAALDIAVFGVFAVMHLVDIRTGNQDEDTVTSLVGCVFSVATSIFIVAGGFQMIRMRMWPLAFGSAVACVIPAASPCCMLGIPFGIWAIVVLNNKGVKQAFREGF